MDTDEIIRIPEAARRLGIPGGELYLLIADRVIPHTREGEHRLPYVRASDIEAYRKTQTTAAP